MQHWDERLYQKPSQRLTGSFIYSNAKSHDKNTTREVTYNE
jgi:hypothetical protein